MEDYTKLCFMIIKKTRLEDMDKNRTESMFYHKSELKRQITFHLGDFQFWIGYTFSIFQWFSIVICWEMNT